jgi:hypothetical protein
MLATIFANDLGSPLFIRDFLPTLVVKVVLEVIVHYGLQNCNIVVTVVYRE